MPKRHHVYRQSSASPGLALVAVVAVIVAFFLFRQSLQVPPDPAIPSAIPTAVPQAAWIGSLFEVSPTPIPSATPTRSPSATPVIAAVALPFGQAPPGDFATADASGATEPDEGGCVTYALKDGETVYNVAGNFGVALTDLLRANLLTEEAAIALPGGYTLIIPWYGCALPTATPSPAPTTAPRRVAAAATPAGDVAARNANPPNLDLNQFRLHIPALNINLVVGRAPFIGNTWDFSQITRSAAYLDGLALPGLGGNVVIGAHSELAQRRPGPFYRLGAIQPGMEVLVTYNGSLYRYIVERKWLVVPADLGPIDQGAGDVLTLLTCDGYNANTDEYDTRLIVRAYRVP